MTYQTAFLRHRDQLGLCEVATDQTVKLYCMSVCVLTSVRQYSRMLSALIVRIEVDVTIGSNKDTCTASRFSASSESLKDFLGSLVNFPKGLLSASWMAFLA